MFRLPHTSLKRNIFFLALLNLFIFILFSPLLVFDVIKRKRLLNFHKILIIELWGIGDLVMMSSMLPSLNQLFPNAEVTLLSKHSGRAIFEDSGNIDRFIEFDFPWTHFRGKYHLRNWDYRGMIKVIRQLRKERFDLILDARGDIRNNLLSFLIGAKRRIGYNFTGGGYFLTDLGDASYKNWHRIEAWANLLSFIGTKLSKPKPNLFISEKAIRDAENFLKVQGIHNEDLLIGIHPGAGIKIRCWPLTKFANVAKYAQDNYNAKIIVFIEPDGYGENIPIEGNSIKVKTSLKELVAIISKLDLLICNDSAAMHIASGVDTSVLAIFGPGDAEIIGPYGNSPAQVIQKDMACRPCFDNCKYNSPLCLNVVEIDDVIKATDAIIKKLHRAKINV